MSLDCLYFVFYHGLVFGSLLSSASLFLGSLCLPPRSCFCTLFVFRVLLIFSFGLFLWFVFGPPLAGASFLDLLCWLPAAGSWISSGFRTLVFGARFWASSGFRGLVFGPLGFRGIVLGPPLASGASFFGSPLPSRGLFWISSGFRASFLDLALFFDGLRFWTPSGFRTLVFGPPLASGASFLDLL